VELVHEFTVSVPVERAWEVLTDVQRIAPCMPGAELTGVEGDTYHGLVKVKVGPISAQYKGTASFAERDEASHRVVLKASGRDARGQGNAAATVTAQMTPAEDGTVVSIVTDLSISGRVAQFGRGVMGDVSAKLLEQFVRNLEADVLDVDHGGDAGAGEGGAATSPDATVAGTAPDATGTAPDATAAAGAGAGAGRAAPAEAGAAPASAAAPGAAAPGTPGRRAPANVARTDAVRPMGIIMRSVATRLGQSITRFFRRLAGRAQDTP